MLFFSLESGGGGQWPSWVLRITSIQVVQKFHLIITSNAFFKHKYIIRNELCYVLLSEQHHYTFSHIHSLQTQLTHPRVLELKSSNFTPHTFNPSI